MRSVLVFGAVALTISVLVTLREVIEAWRRDRKYQPWE